MELDPAVRLALALALAWVLVEAGLAKLRRTAHYASVIDDYRVLARGAGHWLARPLGVLEVALGVALLLPATQARAAPAAAALLALYLAAMAINLLRGRRTIDCGCGGAGQRLSEALLLRNALLVAAATVLWLAEGGTRALAWLDGFSALAAATTAVLVYASVNGLLANRQLLKGFG